ncbi:hypothetical protein K456DRAFT_58618 [Colletotrichum gloeosporioides 23]|nr:hypothetical protein K456DRAFT_58618 [Colletotrichum gloeosporioides 23]
MHIPAALISIPKKRLNINPPSRPLPESSSHGPQKGSRNPPSRPLPESSSHGPQKGSRNPPARNALTRDTSYPSPIPSRTHLNINDLHSRPLRSRAPSTPAQLETPSCIAGTLITTLSAGIRLQPVSVPSKSNLLYRYLRCPLAVAVTPESNQSINEEHIRT